MKKFTTFALGFAAVAAISGQAHADHLNIDVKGAMIQGDAVVFPDVKIDKDGYVVIHAVEDGKPVVPASIGHTAVKAGDSKNVSVTVDGGAKKGTDYVAMIHYETNGNSSYDFGPGSTDVDVAGMKPDNTAYALPFKVGM